MADSASERLGRIVKRRRTRTGETQSELAARMNGHGHSWHQSTVNKIENGQRPIVWAEAVTLATVLDFDLRAAVEPKNGERATGDPVARQLWADCFAGTLGNWGGLSEQVRDRIRRIVADLDAGELLSLVRAYLGALDDLMADPCGTDALVRMNRRDDLLHALYIAAGVPCHCDDPVTPDLGHARDVDTHGRT
jgi:transcriptional regulator with XRE-family HTH domain